MSAHLTPSSNSTLRWVLDTNVVLDWLHFRDPRAQFLDRAATSGIALQASTATLAEFRRVIACSKLEIDVPRQSEIVARYESAVVLREVHDFPKLPQCRDPDDQCFLELAVAGGAGLIVTRDKALLKLKSKLLRFSVRIESPGDAAALMPR